MTEAATRIRVYIVDDHPVFAHGLSRLVDESGDLFVCGVAHDAPTALAKLGEVKPDVIIVDLSLAGTTGLDLIKAVKLREKALPILVISMHDESLYAERALRAGASGYVMKEEPGAKMLEAIRSLARGKMWMSDALTERLLSKLVHESGSSKSALGALSDRELEVFTLIGRGRTTREIGESLHISVKTVESHRLRIRQKLSLKDGREVLMHALKWTQDKTDD